MTNTPTSEDIAEGVEMQRQWHHGAAIGLVNWSQFAMLARQRRETRNERVMPVLPVFTGNEVFENAIGTGMGWSQKLADYINARVAASGFAQVPTEAAIQARIDAAVLAEREAIKANCEARMQSERIMRDMERKEGRIDMANCHGDRAQAYTELLSVICARTTNPEIAVDGSNSNPSFTASLPGMGGDKDRTIKPGFVQPDPGYHERDEPMIATQPEQAPTCGNCRFWDSDHRNCLRYPPIMSLHMVDNQRPSYDVAPFYPWVNADCWCGEHQPREGV